MTESLCISDKNRNRFLVDWLTFTTKIHNLEQIKDILGLSWVDWIDFKGRSYGYTCQIFFGGIRILWGGRDDMGFCVEMSGQGCRSFESYGQGDWAFLIGFLLQFDIKKVHLTRIDIAFDDRTGILDLDKILDDSQNHNWRGLFRSGEIFRGIGNKFGQNSVTFGSRQSLVRLRIYDKAQERGFIGGLHWIRVELQLRDDRANVFIRSSLNIGLLFAGVLRHYLQFCVPSDGSSDTNKRRWLIRDYWARFLGTVEPISIFDAPGVEYNMARLQKYVVGMAGGAVLTYLLTHRLEDVLRELEDAKRLDLAPKYLSLVAAAKGAEGVGDYQRFLRGDQSVADVQPTDADRRDWIVIDSTTGEVID